MERTSLAGIGVFVAHLEKEIDYICMNSAVSASSVGERTRLIVGGSCNTLKPAVSQEFLLIYFLKITWKDQCPWSEF